MSDTPDWVLIEAARRSKWDEPFNTGELRNRYNAAVRHPMFRALCDMIAKYEQPPVDRKELCAREAWRLYVADSVATVQDACLRAIELWEEGFGS